MSKIARLPMDAKGRFSERQTGDRLRAACYDFSTIQAVATPLSFPCTKTTSYPSWFFLSSPPFLSSRIPALLPASFHSSLSPSLAPPSAQHNQQMLPLRFWPLYYVENYDVTQIATFLIHLVCVTGL